MIYYLLIDWDHGRGRERSSTAQLTRLFTCEWSLCSVCWRRRQSPTSESEREPAQFSLSDSTPQPHVSPQTSPQPSRPGRRVSEGGGEDGRGPAAGLDWRHHGALHGALLQHQAGSHHEEANCQNYPGVHPLCPILVPGNIIKYFLNVFKYLNEMCRHNVDRTQLVGSSWVAWWN